MSNYDEIDSSTYLRCTQVLINITSNGCTKLWIHVIGININNFIICFHLCKDISIADIPCNQINTKKKTVGSQG